MKTLRDLQLFSVIEGCNEFKAAAQLIGEDRAAKMFDMVCGSTKNIAFQSIAMQMGLGMGLQPTEAFKAGAGMLIQCKDLGIYQLKHNDKSIWVRPLFQFDAEEHFLLDPMNFEFHEEPDVVLDNKDIILSTFSQHKRPLNLEFLNKINRVPFELDTDVLFNFAGKNMPITYNKVTAEYLNKQVFFRWRFDSRGRSYSEGYGINIQGNKTVRSVVNFANKEVNQSIDPLLIMLANARGFDDWTWERRIEWAKKQEVAESFTIPKGTKYPERYAKACRAILDFYDGEPSGVPMEADATASGIQIMAAITGCITTGKQVNLVEPKRRRDVYRAMAKSMNAGIKGVTTRDEVKYPVMTH